MSTVWLTDVFLMAQRNEMKQVLDPHTNPLMSIIASSTFVGFLADNKNIEHHQTYPLRPTK